MTHLNKLPTLLCACLLATSCSSKKKAEDTPASKAKPSGETASAAKPVETKPAAKPAAKPGNTAALSAEELKQAEHCATVLADSEAQTPEQHWPALVAGCGTALGLADVAEAGPEERLGLLLAARPNFACKGETVETIKAAGPGSVSAHLLKTCGPEHYGLTKDSAQNFSEGLFVAQAAGDWAAEARNRAEKSNPDLAAKFDSAFKSFQIRFPLTYRSIAAANLPTATHVDHTDSLEYVLVAPDTVQVNAMPTLSIGSQGTQLKDGLASSAAISVGEMQAAFDALPKVSAKLDSEDRQAPHWLKAALPHAPFIAAPATLPAARVLEIASALGRDGAYFGVKAAAESYKGEMAVRARVALGRSAGAEAPVYSATIEIGDKGLNVDVGGKVTVVPRTSEGFDAAAFADVLLDVKGITEGAIALSATGSSTHQDLLTVLDGIATAGITKVTTLPAAK